jgi:hypothetical protein
LFNTIKNAVNSVRDLPKVIDKHTKELKRIKDLVNLIQAEQALRTLAVGAAAEHVQDGAEKLRQRLELLKKHSETSKVEQVIRAFISGSNESKVEKIMKELVEAKLGLVANMLVVNVGLTQGVDKSLKVNTATIQRVNDLIQERLGDNTKSLKLAERMKGRAANGELLPLHAFCFCSLFVSFRFVSTDVTKYDGRRRSRRPHRRRHQIPSRQHTRRRRLHFATSEPKSRISAGQESHQGQPIHGPGMDAECACHRGRRLERLRCLHPEQHG